MSEKEYIFVGRAQLKTRDYIHQIEQENRELNQEIERLNNIINELEKMMKNDLECACSMNENGLFNGAIDILEVYLDKLQELKGSNEPSFEEMVGFVENVCKDIKNQSTLHEQLEEERKTIAKIVGDFKEVISNE